MESTCLHQYLTHRRNSVSTCWMNDFNNSSFKEMVGRVVAVFWVVGVVVVSCACTESLNENCLWWSLEVTRKKQERPEGKVEPRGALFYLCGCFSRREGGDSGRHYLLKDIFLYLIERSRREGEPRDKDVWSGKELEDKQGRKWDIWDLGCWDTPDAR